MNRKKKKALRRRRKWLIKRYERLLDRIDWKAIFYREPPQFQKLYWEEKTYLAKDFNIPMKPIVLTSGRASEKSSGPVLVIADDSLEATTYDTLLLSIKHRTDVVLVESIQTKPSPKPFYDHEAYAHLIPPLKVPGKS